MKQSFQKEINYADSILQCMSYAMNTKSNAILIGQGIRDHKSVFGTTTGLAVEYGKARVIESPIAEEMMTGFGLGASLNGLYPIMTHIRADFSFVAMNQIVNLYAKYRYMYGGQFKPSGLIRLIVGRSWGQGAQHAQSPQSIFSHVPGLKVIMPCSSNAILENYIHEIDRADRVVISLEHRNLFDIKFNVDSDQLDFDNPPSVRVAKTGTDLTIIATSIMVLEALRASVFLDEHYGISAEVVELISTTITDSELIFSSVLKSGRLLVADTSWVPYGVGSEVSRIICERDPSVLKAPIKVVGMEHTPCPTGKTLEDLFYPSVRTIVEAALQTCGEQTRALPDGESYRDYYRKFKGPF